METTGRLRIGDLGALLLEPVDAVEFRFKYKTETDIPLDEFNDKDVKVTGEVLDKPFLGHKRAVLKASKVELA